MISGTCSARDARVFSSHTFHIARGAGALALLSLSVASGCSDSPTTDTATQTMLQPSAAGAAGTSSAPAPMPGMSVMRPTMAGQSALTAGTGSNNPGASGSGIGGRAGTAGAAGNAAAGSGAAGSVAAGSGGASAQGAAGSAGFQSAAGSGTIGPNEDECGPIPTVPPKATSAGQVRGAGTIEYDIKPPNEWLSLRTQLWVPVKPQPMGVVFLWPGLQPLPSGMNFQPIGNGVLQPVLTWGQSCATGEPAGFASWWISPMYVNVSARDRNYQGCKQGPVISVAPKAGLELDMFMKDQKWVQTVLDPSTMKKTEFTIDLKMQQQGRAFFVIELPNSGKPTEDVVFTRTIIKMATSQPSACEPIARGMRDAASKSRVSADGKTCCIDHIVLRAQGVTATTMDP